MSLVSEIKCPKCGQWSSWTGKVDDKCASCGDYLEPERFRHVLEHKGFEDLGKKDDYLVMKESDETIVQLFKLFINSLRWGSYYVILLFVIFITIMLVVYGLLLA